MGGGRRTAWILALLAGSAGCGGELPYEEAILALVDRADRMRVALEPPPGLPDGLELEWLREGLAGLALELAKEESEVVEAEGIRVRRWTLPLPKAETAGGAEVQPEIAGLPIPRVLPGVEPAADQTAGYWIHGRELAIAWRGRDRLPERIRLSYPAYAAQLAETSLADGHPTEEIFRVRRIRGDVSVESLVVPTGATLRMQLPPLPGGMLQAGFSTLAVDPRRNEGDPAFAAPRVRVRLGGEEIFERDLQLNGQPTPLGFEVEPGHPVEPSDEPTLLEIEAEGPPGSLVFVENPLFARPRTWKDGPNVLLVLVDTLRADRVGAFGSRAGLTPALDRLAEESVLFTQCWSTSSWTLPAVATILTSNHAAQHQAWLDDRRLGRGLTTLAEVFRQSGYRTAAFTDGAFVGPYFGLDRGFMLFDARGGGVEEVVERTRSFLEGAGDGPWFLLLHTYEVHAPYEPPEEAMSSVLKRHPDALRGQRPEPHLFYDLAQRTGKIPRQLAAVLAELYDEEVRYTDAVLGAFLDELREADLLDSAVVCLTSDHGEEFGEHGLLGHGDTLYAEQLHVPLILHLPGGERAGLVEVEPVSLLDLAPTLLDAAELGHLIGETTFVGHSLLDRSRTSPVYAVRYHEEVGPLHALRMEDKVVIQGRYYFSEPRGVEGTREYYDIAKDRSQQRNLATPRPGRDVSRAFKRLKMLSEFYGEARVEESQAAIDARTHMELRKLGY